MPAAPTIPTEDRYLSKAALCRALGLDVAFIDRCLQRGLYHYRIGGTRKFTIRQFRAWMEDHASTAASRPQATR